MSESQSSANIMGWNEGEELVEYRQVSRLALFAVAGSFFSFLAFVSPLLWLLPILGLILAVFAVITIRRDANLTGGRMAFIALVICAFNAFAAPAQTMARQNKLASLGRQHFETWRKVYQSGDLPQAFELVRPYADRFPVGADLEKLYGPQKVDLGILDPKMRQQAMMQIITKEQEMEQFFGSSGCKLLRKAAEPPKYIGLEKVVTKQITEVVTLKYAVHFESEGRDVTHDLLVEMERRVRPEIGETHWRVLSLNDPEGEDDVVDPTKNVEKIYMPGLGVDPVDNNPVDGNPVDGNLQDGNPVDGKAEETPEK